MRKIWNPLIAEFQIARRSLKAAALQPRRD
jgi:hypothetical protein